MSNKKFNSEGNLFNMGNVSESESENISVSESKIVIKRKRADNYTMPMTYRLKVSTIEQIRKQAREADMGVAEYLQKVLDSVLDIIEIR